MKALLVALALACASFVSLSSAEAGCRCGKSYISDKKCCHKCPCACSCCTADCSADVPDLVKMLVPGAAAVWCEMKARATVE